MMRLWVVACVMCFFKPLTANKNVLIIQPLYTNSHEKVMQKIVEYLIDNKGYRATLIRYKNNIYSRKVPSMTLIERKFNSSYAKQRGFIDDNGAFLCPGKELWETSVGNNISAMLRTMTVADHMFPMHCKNILEPGIIETLSQASFDVAFVDLYTNDCGLMLANELRLPVVGYWGFRLEYVNTRSYMDLNMPSVKSTATTSLPSNLNSMWLRAQNFFTLMLQWMFQWKSCYKSNSIIEVLAPGRTDIRSILSNINVILIHSSPIVTQSMALPPNMISIGCVHCRPPLPLSESLEAFMQSSGQHGVVLMSFGISMYKPNMVPLTFMNTFLSTFEKFDQRFIVTSGRRKGLIVPPNVYLVEFVPQIDILGHPKTRLFITHCGVSSVMEAFYSAVPMMAVPGWVDQAENALFLEENNLTRVVKQSDVTAEKIELTLRQLLYDHHLRERVKIVSQMIRREHNMESVKKAAHWIELVAEFGEMSHLKLSNHLNMYQYWSLDVLVSIVIFLGVLIYLYQKAPSNYFQK